MGPLEPIVPLSSGFPTSPVPLGPLVSVGLHRAPQRPAEAVLRWAPVLFASLYGISDEVHQLFVPGRTFSIQDMMADGLGALAGQGLCLLFFRARSANARPEKQGTS